MEQTVRPIDVICVCSANGDIRPLRVRITDESHHILRIDIDEIVNIRPVQYVGIEATIFLCRATVGQKACFLELKYTIRSHSWSLIRKVC